MENLARPNCVCRAVPYRQRLHRGILCAVAGACSCAGSFILREELASQAEPNHIFQSAPDLAIEVVSESENALELREKIQNYLDAGSKAALAFYPKVRVIAIYDKAGVNEVRRSDPGRPEILKGFQAKAGPFFD